LHIYYLHIDNELDEKQLKLSMEKSKRLTNSMSKTIDDFSPSCFYEGFNKSKLVQVYVPLESTETQQINFKF